ncbi:MAG TPA: hypothetical protein VFJ16_28125 [Longimicrobium sp.]|nr:hypothetical protein [Longimicrobium sp.]
MRSVLIALVAGFLSLLPVSVRAQTDVPPRVTQGLDAYRSGSVEAAADAWFAGYMGDTYPEMKRSVRVRLRQFEHGTGPIKGYEYVGEVRLGPSTRRIFYTLLYRDFPAFARFDVYQAGGEWRVLGVIVDSNPAEVFPHEMLAPAG